MKPIIERLLNHHHHSTWKLGQSKKGPGLVAGILFLLLSTSASTALAQKGSVTESAFGIYEVRMIDPPVIGYEGSSARYAATKPERGSKINKFDSKVQNYRAHLRAQHDQALGAAKVPTAKKIYDHGYAVNGFTVKMSYKEAQKLARQAGVASVTPEQMSFRQSHDGYSNHQSGYDASSFLSLLTNGGSNHQSGYDASGFLGISGKHSLRAAGYTGKDVVIGIFDAGIWPEHPSFADDGHYGPLPAGSFTGTACEFGTSGDPNDAAFQCNNKIIEASVYSDVAHAVFGADLPGRYDDSARDEDGHGTLLASIAAGGAVEAILSGGVDLGNMAGMAPRARLAMYKTWWDQITFQGDIVAGIDQAVADGVDVINISFRTPPTPSLLPTEISTLFANDAGIVTSVSAANDGPDPGTVSAETRDPWVLSVAAGSIDQIFTGEVILKDGPRLTGVSVSPATPIRALVNGGDCSIDSISANGLQVSNKIVFCDDVLNSGADVNALAQAGAIGLVGGVRPGFIGSLLFTDRSLMIIFMDSIQGPIPIILLESKESDKLLRYMARTPAPKASIGKGGNIGESQGSIVTFFSSRGPAPFMEDIIKPEIVAPGSSQVLAAAAPGTYYEPLDGSLFRFVEGTSLAAPHAAGVMALVKQAHPDWSAAMIKSALMTTARQDVTTVNGDTPANLFDMGSGYLQADGNGHHFRGSVIDPGLVYDARLSDYLAYLCGAGFSDLSSPDECNDLADGHSLDPSNLNLASIGIASLPGSKTITRTVTNVAQGNGVSRFDIKVKAPKGYTVAVSPSVLNVNPGQTASYNVTITNVNAPIGEWRFGSLTLQGKGNAKDYQVYSPIAVNGTLFKAPGTVFGTGASGSLNFPVAFGYTGDYVAEMHGLAAAQTVTGTVVDDPSDVFAPSTLVDALVFGNGVFPHTVEVPDHTAIVRFALSFASTADDLDLWVYGPDGNLVGGGFYAGFGGTETVDVLNPAPGTYTVLAYGYIVVEPSTTFTLSSWVVGANVNNATIVAPGAASVGSVGNIKVNWGLSTSGEYLGVINHMKDGNIIGTTVIDINKP